jgi:hypothetical protein
MRPALGLALFLLACASPLQADTPANAAISGTQIVNRALLPIVNQETGSFNTPAFKFFEGNKLVGLLSGAATNARPLASAVHTLPDGFANQTLKQELIQLKLAAPTSGQTVLVYLQNGGACPPCDHIVADVRSRLAGVGWGKAQVLVVDIVLN